MKANVKLSQATQNNKGKCNNPNCTCENCNCGDNCTCKNCK
jgi:hypothetical protein